MLAGVTPADKGTITIRGSIFSMIELTAGMSMELSGKENIRILGIVMGLSNQEIEDISPLVEDFSELGDWLRKPVWQYSSGMLGRLAFGIAVYMKADILLVDEVLSTGDILFQKKCQLRIQQLLSGGTTLIFVSHSPYQVERPYFLRPEASWPRASRTASCKSILTEPLAGQLELLKKIIVVQILCVFLQSIGLALGISVLREVD
jgi:ABC-type multidrug transport system ATPase subunit